MKRLKSMAAIAVLSLTVFTTNVNAQEKESIIGDTKNYDQGFRLGFGVNAGYVFEDAYDFALGADARLQYDLSKRTSLTLTAGFTNLFVGEEGIKDLGFIPVKAGFKAFVWEDQFYVLGEVGAGFAVTNGYDDTTLILSPGIGYANKYFDASLRYEYYNDFPTLQGPGNNEGIGQLSLRLAYGFTL